MKDMAGFGPMDKYREGPGERLPSSRTHQDLVDKVK